MKIGKLEIDGNIFLAPLAGWTDYPYRKLCKSFGASLVTTEMVSALGMRYNSKNTKSLLITQKDESPVAVQLFGSDPNAMAEAVQNKLLAPFDIIDINMGCPVPKVVKQGEGSALMKDLALSQKIISACKSHTDKPVTVKCRLGFENNNHNVLEFAKMCEQAGADAITIHGRTRNQFYSGKAQWDEIFEVANQIKIPVIANGDIKTKQDYEYIMNNSKCQGVAIGRASIGNPMIFSELMDLKTQVSKIDVIKEHCKLLTEYYSPQYALTNAKKNLVFYISNIKNATDYRNKIFQAVSMQEVIDLTIDALNQPLQD